MSKSVTHSLENTVMLHTGEHRCKQHRVVSPPPSGGLPLTAEQGSGVGWLSEGLWLGGRSLWASVRGSMEEMRNT